MSSEGATRLERVIAPLCEAIGTEVVDVEFRPGTIAVTIDRPGGLDLEALSAASRAVSDALDADESLAPNGHYELEVSSPGLERRLRRPEHFKSALGSTIAVRTVAGAADARRATGTLLSADDEGIDLALEESSTQRRIAYADIDRAHTVFNWSAALREGKQRANRPEVAKS